MENQSNLSEAQADHPGINPPSCPNINSVLVNQQSSEKSRVAESSQFIIYGNNTSIHQSPSTSNKMNNVTTADASVALPEIKPEDEPAKISAAAKVTQLSGPNVRDLAAV